VNLWSLVVNPSVAGESYLSPARPARFANLSIGASLKSFVKSLHPVVPGK
jgi:hypothetical protein